MIKLTQTKLGEKGNCFFTCISCITEIPLEELPDLFEEEEKQIEKNGYADWLVITNDVLKPRGVALAWCKSKPKGYSIATGVSPRNPDWRHCCVAFDGEIVHDPHPDRTGIVGEVLYYDVLLPIVEEGGSDKAPTPSEERNDD